MTAEDVGDLTLQPTALALGMGAHSDTLAAPADSRRTPPSHRLNVLRRAVTTEGGVTLLDALPAVTKASPAAASAPLPPAPAPGTDTSPSSAEAIAAK